MTKVQDLEVKEKELNSIKEIKPEFEKAKTRLSAQETEIDKLKDVIAELTKDKEALKEELETEREEKAEVMVDKSLFINLYHATFPLICFHETVN